MSTHEEEMETLILKAKVQIHEWYGYEYPTKPTREFIESQIWSASLQHGEGAGNLTKLFVLEGGEAKGTILADYFNGIVIAYDRTFSEVRMWRIMR